MYSTGWWVEFISSALEFWTTLGIVRLPSQKQARKGIIVKGSQPSLNPFLSPVI